MYEARTGPSGFFLLLALFVQLQWDMSSNPAARANVKMFCVAASSPAAYSLLNKGDR